MDDVLLNKAAAIERAVRRVREEHAGDDARLLDDQTRQDAIILNLQRACESSIDAAMHLVRIQRLGVPQESREAFELLERAGHLDGSLADRLKRMVGFRNIAVHDYQRLDIDIVRSIVHERLDDFGAFARLLVRRARGDAS
ncbi:MAG: DUF86 domain-containing protein [Acidobacteria bacterium]|nr:DUF86 domain-containing protein [Acidobacteriota bacterium]